MLDVNGIRVQVRHDGPEAAPPLLLLHSLGTSLHVWDPVVPALAAAFRVVRPDMRGHGGSTVRPGPYTIEQLGADALGVMQALGLERAHVAGLSIGGLVAQELAHQAPGRVQSLLLIDTALAIPPANLWHERAALVRAKGMEAIEQPVIVRWVTPEAPAHAASPLREMLLATEPEGYAASAEAIAAADLTAQTRQLDVPTLVLVGDADEATPMSSAQALRDAIAGATLEVIPGAAHIPMAEQPAAVAGAMLRFLLPDPYAAGMRVRRAVLGAAHVERASAAITELDREFQRFITETAWGKVWARPHFDRRTRSIVTLALLAGLGREEEFKLHVRATRNTGATPEDIAELLLHVAVYAGVPAANSALRLAKQTLAEMER
ncbi:MAG: 3-oxoadipate enol-lactonase [Acetobacteraceae bacterium]|nr:3-oxoadipate enol-lactonase [Acetobacteraceae bacterium]